MKTLICILIAFASLFPSAFGAAAPQPLTKIVNGVALPLYVLRRVSDKFVINPRAISNTTGLPNPGPDQEYLPIMTDAVPDNDPDYTIRTQVEAPNETARQWELKYVVTDRPTAEKISQAENYKRFELAKHVPAQDFNELVLLTLAAVLRDATGLELTPRETALKNQLITIAAAIQKNAENLDAIKAAIQTGQKPDLKSGWEPK